MNELTLQQANVKPALVDVPGIDELDKYVDSMLETYKKTPVSPETLAQAKQARTDLNKAYKGLGDTRKKIASQVAGNWPETETRIKEIEKKIQKVSDETLKPQIDDVIEAEKQSRKQLILSEIKKIASEYGMPAENIVFDDKWLNKTAKWNETENAVRSQLDVLKQQAEFFELQAQQITSHAEQLGIDPVGVSGYIGQLKFKSLDEVKAAMDRDVQQAKAKFEVQKAKEQAEYEARKKRAEEAMKVGERLVDKNTGEIVEPAGPRLRNWQYTFDELTDDQKQFLDKTFTEWGISFSAYEV
ncbi:DUF1351 domain-containing protein [Weissella confusa]|uniref:DUF1351 domain-containing protein n=1 Tax=Weissella confusa TaxID=1583 RepID=UPI00223BE469|nr:DUF1351 domain-containing protein [Weissella confusa]MCS9993504.1 DUF1351 domain-containing protein [Weissella confusa]